MSFGSQLRHRREALGMSRIELAQALGVSTSAISNYENDGSFPKTEYLAKLFAALSVEPNALFADFFRASDFALSESERALVEKCRALPLTSRQALHAVADALCACRDEMVERVEEAEPRLIPLYRTPAAAGYASPVCGEDFDYITVDESVPFGADFGVRIQGDSMEPHIADGSVVYVTHEALASGDVGIFCVDGDMLCKQYHRDALGMTYLFSLNRKRADADLVFGPDSGRTLVCFGRVLTAHRYPLP